MTRRVVMACALMAVATSLALGAPSPAAGQRAPDKPPLAEQGDDIVGDIQAQVNTLTADRRALVARRRRAHGPRRCPTGTRRGYAPKTSPSTPSERAIAPPCGS